MTTIQRAAEDLSRASQNLILEAARSTDKGRGAEIRELARRLNGLLEQVQEVDQKTA